MKRSRSNVINQEMNLTNMIDVIFSILIVFMISAPLMSQGVQVNLPKADAPTVEQKEMIKVSITKDREVFIADMKVDFVDFDEVFKSLWNGDAPVVVNSDETVNYGLVMQVVSAVQKAGVTKIGFLTTAADKAE